MQEVLDRRCGHTFLLSVLCLVALDTTFSSTGRPFRRLTCVRERGGDTGMKGWGLQRLPPAGGDFRYTASGGHANIIITCRPRSAKRVSECKMCSPPSPLASSPRCACPPPPRPTPRAPPRWSGRRRGRPGERADGRSAAVGDGPMQGKSHASPLLPVAEHHARSTPTHLYPLPVAEQQAHTGRPAALAPHLVRKPKGCLDG